MRNTGVSRLSLEKKAHPPKITNVLSIKNSKYFSDVSFRELFVGVRVLFYKIRVVLSLRKIFASPLAIIFMKDS
jgi:hypothetical protein